MSENRRVVVTGIGAITPLGNNVADTWNGLKNGKNGIAPITLFDTEKYKAKLAAEVKDFDPKEYLEINDVLIAMHSLPLQQHSRQWTKAVSKVLLSPNALPLYSVRVSVASVLLKRSTPS